MESHGIFRIHAKSPFLSRASITPLSAFFACSVNCMPSQCGFIRFPQNFPNARVLAALRAIYAKAALHSQAARLSLPDSFSHARILSPAIFAGPAPPSFSSAPACARQHRFITCERIRMRRRTPESSIARHRAPSPPPDSARKILSIPLHMFLLPIVCEGFSSCVLPEFFRQRIMRMNLFMRICSFISLSNSSHVPQRASSRRAAPRAPPPASPERTLARAASPQQCPPESAGRRPYRPSSPRPAPSFR